MYSPSEIRRRKAAAKKAIENATKKKRAKRKTGKAVKAARN
jgi:hypothetical protein